MKIQNFKLDTLPLELNEPITVTFGTIHQVETLLIHIETDEGITGIGEGSPFAPVTGETMESAIPTAKRLGNALIGKDPLNLENIHHIMDGSIVGNTAVKAAFDIALHDILGKKADNPLYKLLGGHHHSFSSDMTLGIDTPEKMALSAREKVEKGFYILKLKAGVDVKQDAQSIQAIRQEVGNTVRLRVDANQGWTSKEALHYIQTVESYQIDAIEQPLPYWDIQGMAYVTEKSSIPIMADESVHSPQDAIKLVRGNAADMLNIKLMKSGGIYRGEMINTVAESAGLPCMVGCMLESKIGITAGASLAAAKKNITEADMDSFLHLKDADIPGGVAFEKGTITLSEAPGLGIDLSL